MIDNYWCQLYGKRSKDFIDGVVAGVRAYAVWENGIEVVGVMKKPLDIVIRAIRSGLGEKEEP